MWVGEAYRGKEEGGRESGVNSIEWHIDEEFLNGGLICVFVSSSL